MTKARPEPERVAAMTLEEMQRFAAGVIADVAYFSPPNPKQPLADWPSLALQLALMVHRLVPPVVIGSGTLVFRSLDGTEKRYQTVVEDGRAKVVVVDKPP